MKRYIRAARLNDFYDSDTIHNFMTYNNFGGFDHYQVLDNMTVKTTSVDTYPEVGPHGAVRTKDKFWKFVKTDDGNLEAYQITEDGKKLSDAFTIESSRYVRSSYPGYRYTGDPDPTGELEGRIRYLNRFKHWTDVYEEFIKITDKYLGDNDRIEYEVDKFYNKYKGVPVFDKAYEKWTEEAEDSRY